MNETETSNGGASTIKIAFGDSPLQHEPSHADQGVEQTCRFIDQFLQLKASVGDGLNEHEFTQLALATLPSARATFGFVAFSNGFVTFSVPPQNPGDWCTPPRWIAEGKEQLAKKIATDFHLMVCEPPDQLSYIIAPCDAHHHFEFVTLTETVAAAHPQYLKLRLFSQATKCVNRSREVLPPAVPLFCELARLYGAEPGPRSA